MKNSMRIYFMNSKINFERFFFIPSQRIWKKIENYFSSEQVRRTGLWSLWAKSRSIVFTDEAITLGERMKPSMQKNWKLFLSAFL